jgi:hypothetical protein
MRRLLFAALVTFLPSLMAGPARACVPAQAHVGTVGCLPLANSVAGTDYVMVWLPGPFPNSSQLISVTNLFAGLPFNTPVITGGTINNAIIGGTIPNNGTFTNLIANTSLSGAGVNALFASPPAIGGAAPAAGAFTSLIASGGGALGGAFSGAPTFSGHPAFTGSGVGLAVTNNATVGGTFILGTGTPASNPHAAFQAAYNADPSALAFSTRQSIFNTTLSYATTTSNVWENMNSFVYVNGPGTATGEINLAHTYLQVNAGGNVQAAEGYEASALNNGIVNGFSSYLALFNNGPSGTATQVVGLAINLTNQNTTAGAIGVWNAISVTPMLGGGSRPTFYNALGVSDANAGIVTLGGINVGSIGNAVPGALAIFGADNSFGTFPFGLKNLAGSNVVVLDNGGRAQFPLAGVTIQPSAAGANLFVQGPDNSGGTFPFVVKNLAGAGMLTITDNNVTNIASGTFSFAAVGVLQLIQGPDNSAGTLPLVIKNLAAANLFSVADNGSIAAGVTGGTFAITGGLTVSQNIQTGGIYVAGASVGVSCSGAPTVSFASVGGIVTHC